MRIILSVIAVFSYQLILSQNVSDKVKQNNYIIRTQKVITKTDTITQFELAELSLNSSFTEEYKKYMWYKAIVAKVYPYTNLVKEMVAMYDTTFAAIDSKKYKRKYRNAEYEKLEEKFGYFVSKLQHTEGKVFCKLIQRETGLTVYDIAQKYLGGPKAFMWQSISRVCGADLKYEYDKKDEDGIVIEKIMEEIAEGKMLVMKKPYFVPQKKKKADSKNDKKSTNKNVVSK